MHGYALGFSWNIFAFIMIFTNRHMKYFNHNNYMVHVFVGTLMGATTLFYTFFAMNRLNFRINLYDWHHAIGVSVPLLMIVTAFLGKLARDRMFLL